MPSVDKLDMKTPVDRMINARIEETYKAKTMEYLNFVEKKVFYRSKLNVSR